MILGMSTPTFTLLHVILSLIGIATGFVVLFALGGGKLLPRWTALFLVTTILTSVTGFLYPIHGITPGIVLGVLSSIVLLVALVALYLGKAEGPWRTPFVLSAGLAQYFNVFVLFAQLFAKIPALKAIAPTPSSPAFGVTQLVVLICFVLLTRSAWKGYRTAPATASTPAA
jgi:hypothetical protein